MISIEDVEHYKYDNESCVCIELDMTVKEWEELKQEIDNINNNPKNTKKETLDKINKMNSVEFIEYCIQKHKYYLDNPEKCGIRVGYKEWHETINKKYEEVLEDLEHYEDIIEEHAYRGHIRRD